MQNNSFCKISFWIGLFCVRNFLFQNSSRLMSCRFWRLCVFLASPLDGGWSSWSPWETCSKTCGISGGSVLRRNRICNQPPPMNGGASCPGNDTEVTKACFTPCPGKWMLSSTMTWGQNVPSCYIIHLPIYQFFINYFYFQSKSKNLRIN